MQPDLIIPYFPDIATNHRRGDSEDRGTLAPRQGVPFFDTVQESLWSCRSDSACYFIPHPPWNRDEVSLTDGDDKADEPEVQRLAPLQFPVASGACGVLCARQGACRGNKATTGLTQSGSWKISQHVGIS